AEDGIRDFHVTGVQTCALPICGSEEDCVLLYGHLDKQPEVTGWDEDKGPWKPVLQDGKLYGRGSADDGYAIYSSLAAIMALQERSEERRVGKAGEEGGVGVDGR